MHFNRLLGAALAALLFLGAQQVLAASSPLQPKTGTITTENLVDAGACTAGGCVESDVAAAGSVTVQVTGTYTAAGGLTAQVTTDGVNWINLCSSTCTTTFTRASTGATSASITSGEEDIYQVPATGYKRIRITALGAVTGTATVTIQPTELVPSGFASISGGAGDASAANQVTGNASLSVMDDWDETDRAKVNVVVGQAGITAGAGAVAANTPRVTLASDDPGVAHVSRLTSSAGPKAAGAALATTALQIGGTYNATPITVADTQEAGVQIDENGYLKVNVATGGAGGGNVDGTTAHDAVGTAVNPVLVGGYASAAAPTNVSADGDATRLWLLRSGAAAVQPTLGGVLASAGSGANGTGVQRVTIATDDTIVASLATKLDTLNTSVNASTTQLPADGTGQVAMTASFPVVLASDHSNIPANVAQINGVTPLMGAGNTGTGSPRVTIATDNAAIATHGHGATGAAVPANVTAMGARAGANSVNVAQGSSTVAINVSTATTTELVALSGSTQVRVTGIVVIAGGTGNITFVYGTGTACGTGTTSLSGAIPLIANAGLTIGGGLGSVLVAPAGQALCVTTSAAVQMSGFVTYTQF